MFDRKIRLCVNSNIADPKFIKTLSQNCKVKTVYNLIPQNLSADDSEIIIKANETDYHIITANIKHFKRYFRAITTIKIGVIGIPADYLKCLVSLKNLLKKEIKIHRNLYNKFYEIDSAGCHRCWDKSWKELTKKTS